MEVHELDEFIRQTLKDFAWESDVPPPPDFDEAAYLADWPDVAAAIEKGIIKSGFVHYVLVGRSEGRPRPTK